MTKRPTQGTVTDSYSRLRAPMSWLRDLPIWSKLGFIMIVPTIATVVVGTAGLTANISKASDADRARILSGLSSDAGGVVHELQNERALAVVALMAPTADNKAAFDKQTPVTDKAVGQYKLRRAALTNVPSGAQDNLKAIDAQFKPESMAKLRTTAKSGVDEKGAAVPLTSVIFNYRALVDDLLAIRDTAAQLTGGDEDLGTDLRSVTELSRAKEYLALQRIVVLRALTQNSMPADLRHQLVETQVGQDQAFETFRRTASADQRNQLAQTVTGAPEATYLKYQDTVAGITTNALPAGIFTAAQWDAAVVGRANLIRKVEFAIDQHTVTNATALRTVLQRQVLVQTALLLGMLLVSIVFAWLVARTMVRALRQLRHGALTVARHSLPQAVARLRDPALSTQMSPEQIAMQIAEPLPVRSRDEFGQVAEAFNAVHLEAVRTAAEQAALRSSVATMFVNLARRSQILVDRLIGHLDRIERGEEDPDRLAELFQLDHLATRMRRNDENLLVLAGADSTRIQRDAAPLLDVLRAAQSEVEHYTRIEFGMIDRDVELAAHSVNDIVHLVAELLDNATAFSPPDTAVVVEARRVGERVVLVVEDRGIGISGDQMYELNERLANPPTVDVAVSRMMGLVVVARLGNRYGIKVELRPARDRGTVADITLPASVLVPRALGGRSAAGIPAAGPMAGSAGSPFGPPAALEAGPSMPGPRDAGGIRHDVAASMGGLPAPLAGVGFGAPVGAGFGAPAGGQRSQPAWSDLVGANGAEARPGGGSSATLPVGDTLPVRRAGESWAPSPGVPDIDEGPAIPRQRPQAPGYPDEHTPAAWPPVPEPLPSRGGDRGVDPYGMPNGPDLTTEIPRIGGPGWGPADALSTDSSAPAAGDSGRRFVDMTMELPIFREIESAWFRIEAPGPVDLGPPLGGGMRFDEPPAALPDSGPLPVEPLAPAPAPAAPRASESWRTAADEGWRVAAAVAAADKEELALTEKGLPRRVPMTQLVPGGVEKATMSAHRRTPEAVRGLLSAYHRGVQRGRGTRGSDAEHTIAGPQNSQGGKEHEE